MSEFKIKVGLELDDDIKELIHKEIIRQLKQYQNCSVLTSGDNFIWTEVHRDNESSNIIYTPEQIVFKTKNKTLCEVLEELKREMNDIQRKIDAIVRL